MSEAPPEVIAGRYRVLRELARGGMGVVYVVEHLGTGAELALKLMSDRLLSSPKAIARFKREARAPTRIHSEHVVRIIDADTAPELGGAPFLVMELLEGDDLDVLAEDGAPATVVVEWLKQAARALDRAHALGIIHRDLKPANLFLAKRPDGPPIVKVLDFGIVKMLQDPDAVESGAVVGTPQYMSPEQVVAARGTVTPASDVWAMAHVAFNLIHGRHYWLGESPLQIVSEILNGPMPPPSERGGRLGPAFDAWFLRSCAREPGDRFASVGEQIEALEAAVAAQPEEAWDAALATEPPVKALQALAAPPQRARSPRRVAPPRLTVGDEPTLEEPQLEPAPLATPREARSPARTAPSPGSSTGVAAATIAPAEPTIPTEAPPARRSLWMGLGGAVVVGGLVAGFVALALAPRDERDDTMQSSIDDERLASFAPLVAPAARAGADEARVRLGERLFAEKRLSRDGDVACTSCHELARFGTDGKPRSRGTGGAETLRNTPSVHNLPGSFALTWDGREEDLAKQASSVLTSPTLMAADPVAVVAKLRSDSTYVAAFTAAFPGDAEPASFENVARAIAAYEETLVSPGRWDRFLAGDRAALTDDEKAGFNRFVEIGCVTCHFGPHVGATMFQKAGLVKAWPDSKDLGRYEVTKRDADRMVFRVPSLRNVAVTAPYFHDGSVASLPTAVRMMAHHQLGKTLDDRDVGLLVAWLGTLTGEPPP